MQSGIQWPRAALIAGVLVVMAILLFARLGHYAFWDDEAITALGAKGVMLTGDTSVLMDHGNIVAYRNGAIISEFRDRVDPPLETYLTAASFSLLGSNTWAGRLPFALLGLGTCALILLWARDQSWPVLLVLALGLIGNVSFILYSRQCRYYSLGIFVSVVIAFIYWRWKPTPRTMLLLAGASVLLFAANYLNYLALYLCLAIDYLFWQRKKWPLDWNTALYLIVPQLVLNGTLACIWNPLWTQHGDSIWLNTFSDRLTLFLWYWRDLDQAEFFAIPIMLLALWVGLATRRDWLVRGCVAVAIYITLITIVSPQAINLTTVADIRYLVPIIPLAIAIEAGTICLLFRKRPIVAVLVALVVFGTNLFNGGPLFDSGLRSTLLSYVGELSHPPPEPYTAAAQWIKDNVPEGESIWVLPDYMTYPLIFHAPKALYAWQLEWPPRPDFAFLPRIHFQGQEPPDYLIAFGPSIDQVTQTIQKSMRPEVKYQQVAAINVFWRDLYRPELFWHVFEPITGFDPKTQAIYILKRTSPPVEP